MDDWEWEKNKRHLLSLSKTPSSAQLDGLADNDSDAESESGQIHSEPSKVYVELQSKSDFLNSRPDINPAEIVTFTSSQLSHFPHSDFESQLPPSQFFLTSTPPSSQEIVIADSQPWSIDLTQSQQVAPREKAQGFSQTTIPDSQDFSTDISQDPIEVPCTIEEHEATDAGSNQASHHTTSASSIPSRQPDGNLVSFETFSISTEVAHNQEPQESLALPQSIPTAVPPSIPESSRVPFSDFLTQLEFDSGEFSFSAKSRQQSQPDEAPAAEEGGVDASTVQDTATVDDSHQPAQRVLPAREEESQFLTQTQLDFFLASEEFEVVPPTSERNSGISEQRLVLSQHAILPGTCTRGALHPPVVSLCNICYLQELLRCEVRDYSSSITS